MKGWNHVGQINRFSLSQIQILMFQTSVLQLFEHMWTASCIQWVVHTSAYLLVLGFIFSSRCWFIKCLWSHATGTHRHCALCSQRNFTFIVIWMCLHVTFRTISAAPTLKATLISQIFPDGCQTCWNLSMQSLTSFAFCSVSSPPLADQKIVFSRSPFLSTVWQHPSGGINCRLQHRVDFCPQRPPGASKVGCSLFVYSFL